MPACPAFRQLVLALLPLIPAAITAQAPAPARARAPVSTSVDIPFQKFTLPNGLRLIVHEDHKAPVVAVNIWYHVGAKDERPGRSGLVHLFEHMMYGGSEHYDQNYRTPLERAGAIEINSLTAGDFSSFFEIVPVNALDLALWLESDRMGHMLGALTQAKLDEYRGVVKNEKRYYEGQPYSDVFEMLMPKLYPVDHPYSWTTIGTIPDIDAITLDDVREWYQTYYGAANAVVVLAGDIDAKTAKEKIERYFGDLPPGPPVSHPPVSVAKRTGSQRWVVYDQAPQMRIYQVWNTAALGSADASDLGLAGEVLGSGQSSRLYQRLVTRDRIATDVSAGAETREIGGIFVVSASVRPGVDPAKVEQALREELRRFVAVGPTVEELARVNAASHAAFIRDAERLGAWGGKSEMLAMGEVFAGQPDHYKVSQARRAAATPAAVRAAARRWLTDGVFTLEIRPSGDYHAATSGADRSAPPEPGPPVAVTFPPLQRDTLSNGLELVLVERHAVPRVRFDLLLDAGYASDAFAAPGTAGLVVKMLGEGTTTRDALQLGDDLTRVGAELSTAATMDVSTVTLDALQENLDRSLALYTDVILHPAFRSADLERLRQQSVAAIRTEQTDATLVGMRLLPGLLYGTGHPYANPWSGTGTETAVAATTRDDLVRYHRTWFKPNHATLIITGATTLAAIKPKLERLFGGWGRGDIPVKQLRPVPPPERPAVYLIDQPGALHSVIVTGTLAPSSNDPEAAAIQMTHGVLGGDFSARLNRNLSADKHWSHRVYTNLGDARGQRPFIAYASVQADKTKESAAEIAKELSGLGAARPATPDEVARVQGSLTQALAGSWQTIANLATATSQVVTLGLPDRYWDTYADAIRAQTPASVTAAAAKIWNPGRLVWVIVGDRAKIEAGLRELELGELRVIDTNGKPVS